MQDKFKEFMSALSEAMKQELPLLEDARAELSIDSLPYVFTTEASSPSIFVYSIIGALPDNEAAKTDVYATLLHAQYCFSESCGFSFGVDADNSYVLLQALIDTETSNAAEFVATMDRFVKTANVWSKRLSEAAPTATAGDDIDRSGMPAGFIQV